LHGHFLEEVVELLFFFSGPPSIVIVVGAGHSSSSESAEFLLTIRVHADGSSLSVFVALGPESRLVCAELELGLCDLLASDFGTFTPPGVVFDWGIVQPPLWVVSVGAGHSSVVESAEISVTVGVNTDGSSLLVNMADLLVVV